MAQSNLQEVRVDDLELEAAGYHRAMPRRFTFWALAALSFDLTCTWLGTGSSVGLSLTEAGPAGTLWSLVIAGGMTMIVSAGMGELASAYPVAGKRTQIRLLLIAPKLMMVVRSGAQYYWSFMVTSDPYKAFASFL